MKVAPSAEHSYFCGVRKMGMNANESARSEPVSSHQIITQYTINHHLTHCNTKSREKELNLQERPSSSSSFSFIFYSLSSWRIFSPKFKVRGCCWAVLGVFDMRSGEIGTKRYSCFVVPG